MKMKNLLKSLKTSQSSAGYTLIELLIAASATLVVVGAASFGLFSMLQGQATTKAQIKIREETNRTLDLLSNEVRQAEIIDSNISGLSGFNATGKTVVLVLTNPDIPDQRKPVYYLKSNTGTDWLGPQVLYRWGPPLNPDGSYDLTKPNEEEVLIDQVDDTPAPNCQTDWSASPSSGAKGFYACIEDPDGNGQGKMAQLYLNTKFEPDESGSDNIYQATTNVFARAGSDTGTVAPTLGSLTSTSLPPSSSSPPTSCGGVSCWTFQVIGANYACNSSTMWDVKTEVTIVDANGDLIPTSSELPNNPVLVDADSETTLPVDSDAGQQVKIVSVPTNPGGASCLNLDNKIESTDPNQATALNNGDTVPDIPGFQDQNSVTQSLDEYLNPDGTAKLDDNQTLYLFENGQTDPTSKGFDMQDNIVLVTVETSDSGDGGDGSSSIPISSE